MCPVRYRDPGRARASLLARLVGQRRSSYLSLHDSYPFVGERRGTRNDGGSVRGPSDVPRFEPTKSLNHEIPPPQTKTKINKNTVDDLMIRPPPQIFLFLFFFLPKIEYVCTYVCMYSPASGSRPPPWRDPLRRRPPTDASKSIPLTPHHSSPLFLHFFFRGPGCACVCVLSSL